jgi:hypothetical protein
LYGRETGNKEIDKPAKDPDTIIPKAIASIMESFPPGKAKKILRQFINLINSL